MIKMDSLTILCLQRHICIKLVCQVDESQILAVSNPIHQALGKGAMSIWRVSVKRGSIRTRRPQSGITTLKPPAKDGSKNLSHVHTPLKFDMESENSPLDFWRSRSWKLSFLGSMWKTLGGVSFMQKIQQQLIWPMVPGMKMIRMVFHHPKYFATQKIHQYSWLVHLAPFNLPRPPN